MPRRTVRWARCYNGRALCFGGCMRVVLLLLLCLGCAGAEYQRGAYRPPARAPVRAPTTNPTTDAPRYAPPGRAPQPGVYPRTPYTRVLPPTREPGIWAGDEPKASDSDDPPGWNEPAPHITVLDVEIPMPPEVKSLWDAQLAANCAYIADTGMRTNTLMRAELARRPKDARCLSALAFHYCTLSLGERLRERLNERERKGAITPGERLARYRIDSVQNAARDALARECGIPIPEWATELKPIVESIQHARALGVKQ